MYTLITPNYAAHWKVIGTLLGIPEGRLNAIEAGFPTNMVWCCNRMLELWLKINSSVTWKDVIAAVDSRAITHDMSSVVVLHNLDNAGMFNNNIYIYIYISVGLLQVTVIGSLP